jgi:hypothetical protein
MSVRSLLSYLVGLVAMVSVGLGLSAGGAHAASVSLVQTGGTYSGTATPGDTLILDIVVNISAAENVREVDAVVAYETSGAAIDFFLSSTVAFQAVNGTALLALELPFPAMPGIGAGFHIGRSGGVGGASGPATITVGTVYLILTGAATTIAFNDGGGFPRRFLIDNGTDITASVSWGTFSVTGSPPCGDPGASNSNSAVCNGTEPGSTCSAFECDPGYAPSASDPTCGAGTWFSVPTCDPVACAGPPTPDPNANWIGTFALGTVSFLDAGGTGCDPGYFISVTGATSTICEGVSEGVSDWRDPVEDLATCDSLPSFDFSTDLVLYEEDFESEVAYPTTPEVDLLFAGGMIGTEDQGGAPGPAPPILTGTSVRESVALQSPFDPSDPFTERVDLVSDSIGLGSYNMTGEFSGLSETADAEAFVALVSQIDDGEAILGQIDVLLAVTGGDGGPPVAQLAIAEEDGVSPSGFDDFRTVDLSTAEASALIAGTPFVLKLQVDRPNGFGFASIQTDGFPIQIAGPLQFSTITTAGTFEGAGQFLTIALPGGLVGTLVEVDLESFQISRTQPATPVPTLSWIGLAPLATALLLLGGLYARLGGPQSTMRLDSDSD